MISEYLHIADLIKKYLSGDINPDEVRRLNIWLDADERNQEIFDDITEGRRFDHLLAKAQSFKKYKNFEKVVAKTDLPRVNFRVTAKRYLTWAAAIILLIVTAGTAVLMSVNSNEQEMAILHKPSSAILVLADGNMIHLSDTICEIDNSTVVEVREDNAVLSYRSVDQQTSGAEECLNTLIVPRGSDYTLELVDGTVVWLNADSRLEYPVNFTGKTREVKLRGIAYFKVAHDAKKPFIVTTARTTVKVLGTEFCVSDNDKGISLVTLVNGRVNVIDSHGKAFDLIPGQQARITAQSSEVCSVETMYYTAWKDGFFIFNGASIPEIMEELSAWYDVDYVLGSPDMGDVRISARLKKYDDITPILDILSSMNDLGFEKNNRIIKVLKR